MANEIRKKLDAWANFTITLASLASGGARQGTMVANTLLRPNALIFLRWRMGAVVPAAETVVELFLLRRTDTAGEADDGAADADAAITIVNAPLLGTLVMRSGGVANTTNEQAEFDTAPLGDLGTQFTIAVRNSTGQAANATEGNFLKRYALKLPEIQ